MRLAAILSRWRSACRCAAKVITGPASYDIEVLDADPRRVKRLRIAKRKEAPPRTRRRDAAGHGDRRHAADRIHPAIRRSVHDAAGTLRPCRRAGYGFKRLAIAFAAGAISVLAMAPFNIWPVLFLTFPVAVWLIDSAGAGRLGPVPTAAITGWWFGFGYFFAGLYWIGNAFLVDAQIFGWLLPFAVTALPVGLAFFMAAGFALARVLWTRDASRIPRSLSR